MALTVNGQPRHLDLDLRTSLLDALREHLHLTGAKKGCDHGQCSWFMAFSPFEIRYTAADAHLARHPPYDL